jgi:integrase
MATVRCLITEKHIKEATAMASSGETPPGNIHIYSDERAQGLRLIVQKNRASWVVKYKDKSLTIGWVWPEGLRPLKTATAAREMVPIIKGLLDEDPAQVEPFLVAKYAGRDNKAAIAEMRPVVTTWTLQQCADAMIEARTKTTAQSPLRKASVDEINRTLKRPEMKDLVDTAAVLLKRGEVEKVRDKIEASSGISAAKKCVSNIRTILNYCCEYKSGESGLDHKDMWWELLKTDSKIIARTRAPSLSDIVKTLQLAAHYLDHPLPGRVDGKHGVRDNVYAAMWWLILTSQRTSAGLALQKVDFYPDPRDEGFYLAAWDEEAMKGKKTHVLPIPSRAVQHMLPLIEAAADHGSKWAFPSERGSDENDICISRTAVRQFIVRLQGRDPLMRGKDGARDLLGEAGVLHWTPHDLRRSITAVMDDAGIPGGASAVLAHEIKLSEHLGEDALTEAQREEWAANRMAKITKLAYGGGTFLKLKKSAMTIWTDAVLDAWEAINAEQKTKNAA